MEIVPDKFGIWTGVWKARVMPRSKPKNPSKVQHFPPTIPLAELSLRYGKSRQMPRAMYFGGPCRAGQSDRRPSHGAHLELEAQPHTVEEAWRPLPHFAGVP